MASEYDDLHKNKEVKKQRIPQIEMLWFLEIIRMIK